MQQRVPHALQSLLQQVQESTASTEALHKLHTKLLLLRQRIAEHHQSEASARRTRPWQYGRRSAVIDIIFAALTTQEHGFLHHAFGFPVNWAVWTLMSPGERHEEPPDENEDFILNFEDMDKLSADDLQRITAWMESMLASLCQLRYVKRLEREQTQAELFSLSPDGTKLKINPEAMPQCQTHAANEHCNSPVSAMSSSTSAGPVLDWIYGYKALPIHSTPLPGMPASPVAQSSHAWTVCLKRMAQRRAALGPGRRIQDMVQDKLHVAECESLLGRSLRPSWPSHEAAELPHTAILSLLEQESSIAAAKSRRLAYHIDKMYSRMFRFNQQLGQAQAERAFWMAKDQLLRHEMFDLNAACARLRHQDQRTSFCQDVTTDADKFEKVIVPLDHRINKVIIKQQDAAEAAFERHNAQLAKVNAWSRQVNTLKHDMTKGIKHVGCLVRVGQTPETSAEMRATIDAINALGVKFKEEFWPKLCSPGKAQSVMDAMQTQQQQLAQDFEAESAELSLLEAHVLESACDDPGALLLPHLILPYLQKRLEAKAAQFCAAADAGSASCSRDVESVALGQAQSNEEAEDASLHESIQLYRKQLQDVASLSGQRAALKRQLADIAGAKLQEQCRDGQLLYTTYVDDFMLAQIYQQHGQPDVATNNSFVSGLSLECAWLAVLFCSDI